MLVASISPPAMRSTTTAVSRRSPRCFGKMRAVLAAPTWCPARPTRWRPRATEAGDSTSTTRSMAAMSMPSSRVDVATTPRSSPAFSRFSISSRCSRETDPWWDCTNSSPARRFSSAARRSARPREFTNRSVDRFAWIKSSSRG